MVTHHRLPTAVLLICAVLGLLTGVAAVAIATRGDATAAAGSTRVVETVVGESDALRVLKVWDERRSRAYARGDVAALAELYVPGSRTGAADDAVLRGYRDRGLRVTRMRTQVLAARVVHETRGRITLLVTDVLLEAVALDRSGRTWALPHDRPSTRRVVLVRRGGAWQVCEAYETD
jgi:hypothetical protein